MTLRGLVRSWLRPPELGDPEQQRIATVTLPLATIFALGVGIWIPAALLVIGGVLWPTLAAVAATAYATAAALVRVGRVCAGARLLVATAFLATTAGVVAGGVGGPVPSLYAMSIVAAGLVFHVRAAAITAALALVATVAIGFAEALGWIPQPSLPPDLVRDGMLDATIVGLSLALVGFTIRAIRRHEARLAESEARFRALTENAPDLIAELETDGAVIYASPAYGRILGYTSEELSRRPFASLLHPDDAEAGQGVLARILDGEKEIGTLRLLHRDGSWRWFDFEGSAFTDASGARRIVTLGRDVTETRELQEQLQRTQRLDALGRLAAGVAHDLNNFLTVILGAAAWLREGLPNGDPLAEHAADIEEAGRRSAALTQQLLAFGRRQPFHPRVVDLDRLLASMDGMLRQLLPGDVAIETIRGGGLGRVRVDPSRFEQVVLNLVLNARDAMPRGGTLTLETADVVFDTEYVSRHRQACPGRYVMLAVSDTGSGMDPDTAAHAFEPFFTTKPQGRGTGLGLSTVHGIVSQHGGHVEIDSERGVGTTFKVYLPRVEQDAEGAEPVRFEVPTLRGSETVLLAEDSELVRQHVRQILEGNGYRVVEAPDGREALALADAVPEIDAVVTDVMMPAVGGMELARRLWERRPDLPVVFISGYAENGTVERGVERGALLVSKPFTPRELLHALRIVLAAAPPGTRRPS
ncbi:MAG TPA: PAS domain S-box protein [Myxococcota bacterium]|nr:PAS domain S-box protein [Myxococcota bacterium]